MLPRAMVRPKKLESGSHLRYAKGVFVVGDYTKESWFDACFSNELLL